MVLTVTFLLFPFQMLGPKETCASHAAHADTPNESKLMYYPTDAHARLEKAQSERLEFTRTSTTEWPCD